MKILNFIVVLFISVCFLEQTAINAQSTGAITKIKTADALFQAGKFNEAAGAYKAVVAGDHRSSQAYLRLGEIALFGNQLKQARRWLAKSLLIDPNDRQAKALLSEAFYRQDNFQKAASLLQSLGRESASRQMESFKGVKPYQIEGESQSTALKFVSTDPLPVVRVRVNDTEEVNFIIDTGGSEIILDPDFAEKVKALEFGSVTGNAFAGGKQADYKLGRINSITLGEFTIKNVPVHILGTKQFAAAAGGKRVDGILGTVLLYHFLSTLDYPNGELILRRKTASNLKRVAQEASGGKVLQIPFWMAGDHYMTAFGTVNDSQPRIFVIDTGLAGGGFVCPDSTIVEAGIKLPEGQSGEGIGGGGKVRAVPFKLTNLSLGAAKEKDIIGFAGVFPPTLENQFGFRIGGLISHQFFRPYALTFDFTRMKILLERKNI